MLLPVHNASNVTSNEFSASTILALNSGLRTTRILRLALTVSDAWLYNFMLGADLLLSNFEGNVKLKIFFCNISVVNQDSLKTGPADFDSLS